MSDTPLLQVAAKSMIVNDEGKVLIVREAPTGANNTKVGEFGIVGGRLDPGESFEDGLARETFEETGLTVKAGRPVYVGEWRPVIHGVPHQIVAIFVACEIVSGDLRMSSEHDEYAWIDPRSRHEYPMMVPDCYAVDALVDNAT